MQTPAEWQPFLQKFAAAVAGDWPGSPGASGADLLAAEKRLKTELPPSYRAFLSASNGWRRASEFVPVLRSAGEIRWFGWEHREWVEAYSLGADDPPVLERDYFDYAKQHSVAFDTKHLAHALRISEVGDGAVLLLNPMVVWPDGEWEAWFFANWLPGARRYRSFAGLMRHELADRLNVPFEHAGKPGELPTVYLDAPGKAARRVRPREKVPVLEEALEKLKSKKERERRKAAQQLCLLGGRLAIDALVNALGHDPAAEVRVEAAKSLGVLRPREAVESLIATAGDPIVGSTAMTALSGFKDERSAQFLLKTLQENGRSAMVAAHVLSLRNDARAIEHLMRFLTSTNSQDPAVQRTGEYAGRWISQFEEAGYSALAPLMGDRDLAIRRRALRGISDVACCAREAPVRRKAYELLKQRVEVEADPRLRDWLETTIAIAATKNRT